jgi:hypothetical protein
MERPVTVADPKIGTPPIQDRVQLPNHHIDPPITRERPHHFAYSLPDIAARLFARPHIKHPATSPPELEAQKREAFCQCRQPALLLVHYQMKRRKLALQLFPRPLRLLFRSRQQQHIVRITDQPHSAGGDSIAPAPFAVNLVQKDVTQQW